MLTSSNVRVGVSGELSFGPTTSTAPISAAAALTGFAGLGYFSEDGVAENPDVSRETIPAWQNGTIVREVVTGAKLTYEFTMIETKKNNVELYYGTTVTQTATEGTYTFNAANTAGRKSFVLDIIDGGNLKRTYVEEGEVFKGDGVTYAGGEAVAYPCELVAYTDPIVMDTALKS